MNILNATQKMVADFAREEEGAQIVEYGMIIGAVSIALIGALVLLKNNDFSGLVTRVQNCLSGLAACGT
jgi:pilus assembly protein Flp/PilA